MSVLRGLVIARVAGSGIRALVEGNGQRARVGTGLGKRVARGAATGVLRREATMCGRLHGCYVAWLDRLVGIGAANLAATVVVIASTNLASAGDITDFGIFGNVEVLNQ